MTGEEDIGADRRQSRPSLASRPPGTRLRRRRAVGARDRDAGHLVSGLLGLQRAPGRGRSGDQRRRARRRSPTRRWPGWPTVASTSTWPRPGTRGGMSSRTAAGTRCACSTCVTRARRRPARSSRSRRFPTTRSSTCGGGGTREDFPDQGESERYHAQARVVALSHGARVFAVRRDGAAVAFAQLEHHGGSAEITQVYVHPDHRGGGHRHGDHAVFDRGGRRGRRPLDRGRRRGPAEGALRAARLPAGVDLDGDHPLPRLAVTSYASSFTRSGSRSVASTAWKAESCSDDEAGGESRHASDAGRDRRRDAPAVRRGARRADHPEPRHGSPRRTVGDLSPLPIALGDRPGGGRNGLGGGDGRASRAGPEAARGGPRGGPRRNRGRDPASVARPQPPRRVHGGHAGVERVHVDGARSDGGALRAARSGGRRGRPGLSHLLDVHDRRGRVRRGPKDGERSARRRRERRLPTGTVRVRSALRPCRRGSGPGCRSTR